MARYIGDKILEDRPLSSRQCAYQPGKGVFNNASIDQLDEAQRKLLLVAQGITVFQEEIATPFAPKK